MFPFYDVIMILINLKYDTHIYDHIGVYILYVYKNIECLGISNHRRFDCLLNRLLRRRSKKIQSTDDRSIPLIKGQERGITFHLMTSSCNYISKNERLYAYYSVHFCVFDFSSVWVRLDFLKQADLPKRRVLRRNLQKFYFVCMTNTIVQTQKTVAMTDV